MTNGPPPPPASLGRGEAAYDGGAAERGLTKNGAPPSGRPSWALPKTQHTRAVAPPPCFVSRGGNSNAVLTTLVTTASYGGS